jgi:hypothetical protein
MLVDATVARNFAIIDWTDHLVRLCGGTILVAHGILGVGVDEPGELDGILNAFEREARQAPGSPVSSRAAAAVVGLEDFISRRGSDVQVLVPTAEELALAARLQDPAERAWLRTLGVHVRRLDSGEAVSVAIATERGAPFATDDEAGRAAYAGMGGTHHAWTLDLARLAVERGMVPEAEARSRYEELCRYYRFWGAPWA